MIYICSDIHGLYDRYMKLLDTIQLKEEDTLYVLGDMIDRGDRGIDILLDMKERKNVIPFLGNHEHMMLMHLFGYDTKSWLLENNGGKTTLEAFEKLSIDDKRKILHYLNDSWVLKNLNINGHRYSLSHIGVFTDTEDMRADFSDPKTDVHELQKMVWGMTPYALDRIIAYPEELCPTTFISGHVITRRYSNSDDDEIISIPFENGCRYIDIDCGCAAGEGYGQLACLTIDETTGEIGDEIYIN